MCVCVWGGVTEAQVLHDTRTQLDSRRHNGRALACCARSCRWWCGQGLQWHPFFRAFYDEGEIHPVQAVAGDGWQWQRLSEPTRLATYDLWAPPRDVDRDASVDVAVSCPWRKEAQHGTAACAHCEECQGAAPVLGLLLWARYPVEQGTATGSPAAAAPPPCEFGSDPLGTWRRGAVVHLSVQCTLPCMPNLRHRGLHCLVRAAAGGGGWGGRTVLHSHLVRSWQRHRRRHGVLGRAPAADAHMLQPRLRHSGWRLSGPQHEAQAPECSVRRRGHRDTCRPKARRDSHLQRHDRHWS